MRQQQIQNLVMLGVIVLLMAGLGLAYWFGGSRSTAGASGPIEPIKKFRADPGTERENARALVSSIPSVEEETTDKPIEIWGSLDPEDDAGETYSAVQSSIANLSHEEAGDALRAQLTGVDPALPAENRAQLEAALAWALLHGEEPDAEAASDAYARAFNACPDPECRVLLAFVYAHRFYEEQRFDETLDLLQPGRFAGASLSSARLAVEALRGLSLEQLGQREPAMRVYKDVFESALASDLQNSARARDAARIVAMRLARGYRDEGREYHAVAVSRRLRAWLGEERLLLQ